MSFPKVGIIILNWNGWQDTIECLESLYQINYPTYHVIIVDNGSSDESLEKITEYCAGKLTIESDFFKYKLDNKPIKVTQYTREEIEAEELLGKDIPNSSLNRELVIIKNEKNYGFPEGNNIGIKYASRMNTDYFLLLNNDTIVDPNFLTELIRVAGSSPSIGLLGPKIYFYYRPNVIQATGGKIIWWAGLILVYGNKEDRGQYDEITERDFLFGTSFLIKRVVLEKISFMDPYFFFGLEEYDYCHRAKKAGFKILYVPKSNVWHKVGASRAKVPQYSETAELITKKAGRLRK